MVDQKSDFGWIAHAKTKDEVEEVLTKHLLYLKGKKLTTKFIRCDYAGEHEHLDGICDPEGIQLEYVPPHTPQLNGKVQIETRTKR